MVRGGLAGKTHLGRGVNGVGEHTIAAPGGRIFRVDTQQAQRL